jgi:hypothetical protein
VNTDGIVLDSSGIQISPAATWGPHPPEAAFDGTNYFLVWHDRRTGESDVYGARVSMTGVLLDPTGIPVSAGPWGEGAPHVVFDGTNYFVVWDDGRTGANDLDVYGARVSTTGVVLDPSGIPISTLIQNQYAPEVIFDGTNYFIVWNDERYGYGIYGARVSTAGVVLDPTGIQITNSVYRQWLPHVIFNGSNYLVVWEDSRSGYEWDIYGARVTTAGTVLDPSGIPISNAIYDQVNPQLSFDGTNYFVAWEDDRGSDLDIYGTRVDTAGTVLDPNGFKICPISVAEERLPSVVFDGTNYFVAWTDYRIDGDIYGARVDTAGTVLDSTGILMSMGVNSQTNPKVASDGINYFVVWEDNSGGGDILGARVSPGGVVLDSTVIPISTSTGQQLSPYVIFGDSDYFVVWQDYRFGNADIFGARVRTDGVVLDSSGILISAATDDQTSPKVIFGGNQYFVFWNDYRTGGGHPRVYGARVNTDGIVLDSSGIQISPAATWGPHPPEAAFDGTNYFLVWQDFRSDEADVYGARVSTTGIVLDPTGIPVSAMRYGQGSPHVVFDSVNYFVVWDDWRTGGYLDIYGARVSTAGVVLEPAGIPISTAGYNQYAPELIFDGTNYFVVWNDERFGYGIGDIYGARVSTAGVVLDPTGIPITTAEDRQWLPHVVFNSANYVVVWEDYRSGYEWDIYGAYVSTAGVVIGSFVVSNQPEDQKTPELVRGSENHVLITYSGYTGVVQGKIYNTMRVWGKFDPTVGLEETNDFTKLHSSVLLNSPNPFSHTTTIKYSVMRKSHASLKIYDNTGKLVCNLVNDNKKPGAYSINWNGTDDLKRKVPAGVYLYRLENEEGASETKELIILR